MMRLLAALLVMTGCVVGAPAGSADDTQTDTTGGASNPKASSFTFHPNSEHAGPGQIDLVNANALITLCDLTYLDPAQLPAALVAQGVDPVAGHYKAFSNPSYETFAYYVEAGGAAFIVFRGTETNWQNLAQDADLLASSEIIGQVHQGFQIATDAVWADVHDYIAARQASSHLPLYITGHSMGAAMATIATARALLDADAGTLNVAALYAIASPRVGDGAFSNQLATTMSDGNVFFARMVNDCDPVTNVPVRVGPTLIPFYEHISVGSNENDFVDWIKKDATTLARSIPFSACPLAGLDYNFAEHLTPAYLAALAPLLQ